MASYAFGAAATDGLAAKAQKNAGAHRQLQSALTFCQGVGTSPRMDPKTILVVDDEAMTRASLATLLARAGYRVMAAANGAEALQALRAEQRPDLVLLDMIMPVCDGWAFLRHPGTAEMPVVIMTGLGVASPAWAASLGAAGFLHKPFDTDLLLQEVQRHV